MAEAKVPTKRIKTEIKTLRKGLKAEKKKSAKAARKANARTATLSNDMEKLKSEMEKLSKRKASKKQLSEYNLFMRRQLNEGKTFNQAVKLWKAYKSGKPLVKTKVVKRTVVRKIAAKPRIITRTRTIVRNVPVTKTRTIIKRVPITKTRTIVRTIRVPASTTVVKQHESNYLEDLVSQLKNSKVVESNGLSDEELAVRLVSLYFEEIARMGFKRQLELEDVINAYFHALSKLKGKKTSSGSTTVVVQSQPPIVVENKQ